MPRPAALPSAVALTLLAACSGDDAATSASATAATEATGTTAATEATGTTAATEATGTEGTGAPFECEPQAVQALGEGFFTDISDASGIRVDNFVADPPASIPINDHSRLAFADLNGDGLDDVVAHSLYPNPLAGVPFEHLVYLSNGDGTFTHFSDESGLRDVQAGFFVFGDVDNDGDQDCFAGLDVDLSGETNQLLLNDGAGHFSRLSGAGVEISRRAANAVMADFNGDANLDIFVGNGHTGYNVADQLYFGFGDGTFEDVSAVYLAGSPAQPSNGSVACDIDDDGDLDILVATYGVSVLNGRNHLWRNDGAGLFTEVGVDQGFAALATGNYFLAATGNGTDPEPDKGPGEYVGSNGFGIQCEDVNGDGLADVYLATISHPVSSDYKRTWSDPSQLLINQGPAGGYALVNEFLARGLPFNEGDIDASMIDFDNDGRLDLAVTRDKKYEGNYSEVDQQSWFGLMHQRPDGSFASVGPTSGINQSGDPWNRMKAGQNHAWSDIDGDGDLDLLVGGRDNGGGGRPNFLFRNDVGQDNAWLAIRLHGDGAAINRDAIGARVTLRFADWTIAREVKSGRGTYTSIDSRALHFGVGDLGCDYEVEVRWPDGEVERYAARDFPPKNYVDLTYGGAPIVR
ncbi:MAG: CRTAC1 family protein [Nannocystaceae bacterium]